MKTLLSAVLLIAVSAWGQSKQKKMIVADACWASTEQPEMDKRLGARPMEMYWYNRDRTELCGFVMRGDGTGNYYANVVKPKGDVDFRIYRNLKDAEAWVSRHRYVAPVRFTSDIGHGDNTIPDPCNGFACTKPVEMLHPQMHTEINGGGPCGEHICDWPDHPERLKPDGDGIQDIGTLGTANCKHPGADEGCGIVNTFQQSVDHPDHILQTDMLSQPDKAAVPVEPRGPYAVAKGDTDTSYHIISCPETGCAAWEPGAVGPVTTYANDGSTMVKLSDSEYSHLQQLRASVVEEEKRLAVKYGADMGLGCDINPAHPIMCISTYHAADHYEYKGQFLLIDKAK